MASGLSTTPAPALTICTVSTETSLLTTPLTLYVSQTPHCATTNDKAQLCLLLPWETLESLDLFAFLITLLSFSTTSQITTWPVATDPATSLSRSSRLPPLPPRTARECLPSRCTTASSASPFLTALWDLPPSRCALCTPPTDLPPTSSKWFCNYGWVEKSDFLCRNWIASLVLLV